VQNLVKGTGHLSLGQEAGCILAAGAGEQRAMVVNGQLTVATQMCCTLSVDHCVIDSAIGAEFLQAFKPLIEEPIQILL
jgi:pyruvate dehydrogenase E2 component (dihydrolipoamide acetyltransferase)